MFEMDNQGYYKCRLCDNYADTWNGHMDSSKHKKRSATIVV